MRVFYISSGIFELIKPIRLMVFSVLYCFEFHVVKGDANEVMGKQPSRMSIYLLNHRSNDFAPFQPSTSNYQFSVRLLSR